MSDPEMLEEYCLRNGTYESVFGRPPETSHLYKSVKRENAKEQNASYSEEDKKVGHGGNVDYEIDRDGNLNKVVVTYNVEGKRYEVSLAIQSYPDDHIRLEVRRKYKNPLRNVFDNNLLASSVTPIHIHAYQNGCMWDSIKENKIKYPSDEHYTNFVKAALSDIKSLSSEIEKKKEYMSHYEDRLFEKNKRRNREALRQQDREEQNKLKKKKHKELDVINFLVNNSKGIKR